MNTTRRGDLAKQAAVLHALKRGWNVLRPLSHGLPYDLVFEVEGKFVRIQVKCAWFDPPSRNFVVDSRRTKTNRRRMIRELYSPHDFDFAVAYLPEKNVFYVYPVASFIGFKSEIHMVEEQKRQRSPASTAYRDAWEFIGPMSPMPSPGNKKPTRDCVG